MVFSMVNMYWLLLRYGCHCSMVMKWSTVSPVWNWITADFSVNSYSIFWWTAIQTLLLTAAVFFGGQLQYFLVNSCRHSCWTAAVFFGEQLQTFLLTAAVFFGEQLRPFSLNSCGLSSEQLRSFLLNSCGDISCWTASASSAEELLRLNEFCERFAVSWLGRLSYVSCLGRLSYVSCFRGQL